MQGIDTSTSDIMKKMVSVVSQKSGKKRMSDKELAETVHQYVPDTYSIKTLQVLCSSTKYLSFIGVLEYFFELDSVIAAQTETCKLLLYLFIIQILS